MIEKWSNSLPMQSTIKEQNFKYLNNEVSKNGFSNNPNTNQVIFKKFK